MTEKTKTTEKKVAKELEKVAETAPETPAIEQQVTEEFKRVERKSVELFLDGEDQPPWTFKIEQGTLRVDARGLEEVMELTKPQTSALSEILSDMSDQEGW